MNYGKFFRLNNKKSDLGKSITVFDYIWLRDDKSSNDSSEFPVYVTISKDSIYFHAHYYDEKKPEKHLHNTILFLPLSANLEVKDGLTGALVEGFNTNFPRYNEEESASNYLWKLHWKTFLKNKDWDDSDVSYSTLNIFDTKWEELIVEIKQWYENHKKENNVEDNFISYCENKKQIKRFIRKLILDFMFDLEQTKVFQTSPHYEHISIKLKENYFFSALAAKANFYYQWKIYNENKVQPISTEYCLKSAIEWRKHIRNTQSEQAFCGWQKEGWFEDPVREMRNVYKKKEIDSTKSKSNDILKQTYKNEIEKSKKWSVANYDFCFKGCHWGWIPRIFISIVGAWLTFILGTALWGNAASKDSHSIYDSCWQLCDKCSYGINPATLVFCLSLIVGTCICLWHNGRRIKIRKKESKRYVLASMYMTFLGFIYSVLIGYILTLFSFSHSWKEGASREDHFLSSAPFQESYYWIGVCLSLFISLVVQSFMNDKSPAGEL